MNALAVREIIHLPEVSPLEETPDYVLGVFNLRGQIVPVIDLNRRFGHPPQRCHLEDSVVILEQGNSVVGLIVNEVQNVRDIAPAERLPVPSYGADAQPAPWFLTGLVKSGEQVVMLLHLENLLRLSPSLPEKDGSEETLPSPSNAFCPEATPQERAIFQERARNLAHLPEGQELTERLPLALVRLGGEFFGVALQTVQEFAELRSVTPVPCCPAHIVGQTNLRGDLITLVDIAGALGLPPMHEQANRKVVVVNDAELRVGVLVDEVRDILYLHTADVSPVAATPHAPGQEYRRGIVTYGAQMLSLLDLPALLMQDSFLVNESP